MGSQLKLANFARPEFVDIRDDTNPDRLFFARLSTDPQTAACEIQSQQMLAVTDTECEATQPLRQTRIQPQDIAPGLDAGKAALDEIYSAGHCTGVDTFRRRATLDVGDITVERFGEEWPGAWTICPRQYPGADHPAPWEVRRI